jgi:hypothetical protein
MKFKRVLSIELLEEYEKVNIYSVLFDGEVHTEFEKFLLSFSQSHPKDIGTIMARLDRIIVDGVFPRHFRFAGKVKDRTAELPSNIDTAKLRLYCICISPHILILGNGGLKSTRTYNEDTSLNKCVEHLQKIDLRLKHQERTNSTQINGKYLTGNLSFYIEIEDEKQP